MNYSVPTAEMLAIMLGSIRAGAWMLIAPPFNSRLIPTPVKALLSVGLALPMALTQLEIFDMALPPEPHPPLHRRLSVR